MDGDNGDYPNDASVSVTYHVYKSITTNLLRPFASMPSLCEHDSLALLRPQCVHTVRLGMQLLPHSLESGEVSRRQACNQDLGENAEISTLGLIDHLFRPSWRVEEHHHPSRRSSRKTTTLGLDISTLPGESKDVHGLKASDIRFEVASW